ncbi:two-component system sensor histidine kinase DesK [Catenulispora sp. EB89]|uniref:sensor histidine kinase n=1 Tax=Catenulispora sp. EB89 TaxID=3156257 RepID=UPI0035179DB7
MHTQVGGTHQRLRRINLASMIPPLAVVGVLLVVIDGRTWWKAVVLSVGLIATLVGVERWTAGDFRRVMIPCLAVTAGVWLFGALADCPTAFYGITVLGPTTVPLVSGRPRRRLAAGLLLAAYVAAAGATRLLVAPHVGPGVVLQYLVIPTVVVVVVTGLMFASQRIYDLIAELEQSREREAELAVVRERMRFASDLHDIQGHTLHVVKLKIALAEKLLDSDPERVRQELLEMHTLVGDTIAQTKELAYAQWRLNLSSEVENAKNLFEAAGIQVRVEREGEVDTRASELLGQVLRETTTNILRHAQASSVQITLARSSIAIANDGAPDTPLPELGGLSILGQRLADNGGELTVEQKDGRFLTAAAFPRFVSGSAS